MRFCPGACLWVFLGRQEDREVRWGWLSYLLCKSNHLTIKQSLASDLADQITKLVSSCVWHQKRAKTYGSSQKNAAMQEKRIRRFPPKLCFVVVSSSIVSRVSIVISSTGSWSQLYELWQDQIPGPALYPVVYRHRIQIIRTAYLFSFLFVLVSLPVPCIQSTVFRGDRCKPHAFRQEFLQPW